ncbi:hypothetical protein Cgig2_030086 [Carnegiea gigantea]|uniref:Uncharacterized protein n=1 Tax=Carnegiea gigantea TaxID=171969 RepID=A0A9Q1GS35_9CARY|nr:hypothetical protein Cgig2_030086 [Carnegiea gigantea]
MARFSLPNAEGVAADFELPETVQVTFYAMLLDEAIELGMVRDFMAKGLKSALVGLRWSSLEEPRGEVGVTACSPRELHLLEYRTEQAVEYVRDDFRWSLRDPTNPGPKPFPSDYHGLCPCFDLEVARRYAHDSHIPEMVLAAEYVRDNLRRSESETSSLCPNLLPWNFAAYCPEFNHIVAMQFAHATYIPEMVQAVFYTMVINDVARLRLIRREIRESLMSDLLKLRWDVIEAWLLFIEDKLKDARR